MARIARAQGWIKGSEMKVHAQPVTLDELMAYVDGQLDAERRQQVEALIASDPLVAERVAAMRARATAALHAHYDPVLTEQIPLRLLASQRQTGSSLSRIASVAASVLIGLALRQCRYLAVPYPHTGHAG